MKYIAPYEYEYEENEPHLRSCWKCNGSHQHLKKANRVYTCFLCGKSWLLGKFISDMTEDELESFIAKNKKKLEKPWNTAPIIMSFSIGSSK